MILIWNRMRTIRSPPFAAYVDLETAAISAPNRQKNYEPPLTCIPHTVAYSILVWNRNTPLKYCKREKLLGLFRLLCTLIWRLFPAPNHQNISLPPLTYLPHTIANRSLDSGVESKHAIKILIMCMPLKYCKWEELVRFFVYADFETVPSNFSVKSPKNFSIAQPTT